MSKLHRKIISLHFQIFCGISKIPFLEKNFWKIPLGSWSSISFKNYLWERYFMTTSWNMFYEHPEFFQIGGVMWREGLGPTGPNFQNLISLAKSHRDVEKDSKTLTNPSHLSTHELGTQFLACPSLRPRRGCPPLPSHTPGPASGSLPSRL